MNNSNYVYNLIKKINALLDLQNFVNEITITQTQIKQASDSYEFIKGVLASKSRDGKIPETSGDPFLIGSYARKTKISPLDDIDIFLVLNGRDTTFSGYRLIWGENSVMYAYDDGRGNISSLKILNAILSTLKQTYPSKIVKDQQAVSVFLKSYDLNIDIVPCFAIKNSDIFIIPAGKGLSGWKRSNPKMDKQLLENIDVRHDSKIKPAIKIIKFWNREKNYKRLSGYHIEAIAYHLFSRTLVKATSVLSACQIYFNSMSSYLYNCPDPTGLSEPVSDYLKNDDVISRISMNLRISNARTAARQGSSVFLKYLKT